MNDMNKNDIYEACITGYTSEAQGVCRIGGRAVFVPGALPGETWRLRILKVGRSAVFARGEELLSPASPSRREPSCPSYRKCGGCDAMHMSYEEELRFKLGRVNDALRRIGSLDLQAEDIVPSEAVEGYRNKAVYNFAQTESGPVCGFYRAGSHEVVPLSRCLLQRPESDSCAHALLEWMRARGLSAYDERTGAGFVRHLFVRTSRSGEALCCVVSARGLGGHTASLAPALRAACPGLTGVVLCINDAPGNSVLEGRFFTLLGESALRDTLCGFEFSLSPQAFYQINPPQAEKLYGIAVSMAAADSGDTVLDLYCGAGTISLCLARSAGRVVGAEIVPQAVKNAAENAAANGVSNAEFICADAGEAAAAFKKSGLTPAAVVVDPPRKGMSEAAVRAVASMAPRRVVYVSCDPATLARDLRLFQELGYTPTRARAVDMFPRTRHVETVVLMSKVR